MKVYIGEFTEQDLKQGKDKKAIAEAQEKELIELFGEDYNFPLIKNTRESIYFDTERNRFLNCEKHLDRTTTTNNMGVQRRRKRTIRRRRS